MSARYIYFTIAILAAATFIFLDPTTNKWAWCFFFLAYYFNKNSLLHYEKWMREKVALEELDRIDNWCDWENPPK